MMKALTICLKPTRRSTRCRGSVSVIFLFIFLAPATLAAEPGIATLESLTLSQSARAGGLAGAYGAHLEEGPGMFYNPAGLTNIYFPQAGFDYSRLPGTWKQSGRESGPGYQQLFYANPTNYGNWGAAVRHFNSGTFDVVDEEFVTETRDAADTIVTGSYAFAVGDLSVGTGFNIINSRLADYSARTWAIDTGLLLYLDMPSFLKRRKNNNVSLGASFQNIGPGLSYSRDRSPLPFQYRFSAGWSLLYYKLVENALYFDYLTVHRQYSELQAGMEWTFFRYIQLRGGVAWSPNSVLDGNKLRLAAGASLSLPTLGNGYKFHYGLIPRGGETYHQFGTTLIFGGQAQGVPWFPSFRSDGKESAGPRRVLITDAEKERLDPLDAQVLILLRQQIYIFEEEKGRFPGNLNELLLYLNKKNIYDIPNPSEGQFVYNNRTGLLLIR